MNTEPEGVSNCQAIVVCICVLLAVAGIGILIGHYAIPFSEDDIVHVQKIVTDVSTTTVSLTQEQKDCTKAGGVMDIGAIRNTNGDWQADIIGYEFDCNIPSKTIRTFKIGTGQ